MFVAICALVAAVAAYGWSGLILAAGSRESGNALHSKLWWIGTALQGIGFGASVMARTVMPLLLVQSAIAGGLAVTAFLEHVTGVRRMRPVEAFSVGAVVLGVIAVAVAVVPGTTRPPEASDVVISLGLLALVACLVPFARTSALSGACSGTSFGVGAISARFLVGTDAPWQDLVRFWDWSGITWTLVMMMPLSMVVGQWALTRGLSFGASVAALGSDYLVATIVPSIFGMLLMGEQMRSGLMPVAVAGMLMAVWGTRRLLVHH
ncbi:hypothetical protein [Austwickia chelonae]|uniref:hypothetical protein n=1 Tax=Austwickia chelonae TaxID=100225 RepID=UPI000E25B7CC|nr:hypothetical protein [Austwickia chelonae]